MNQYTDPFEARKIVAWDIRKKAKRTLSRKERAGLMALFRYSRRGVTPHDSDLWERHEGVAGLPLPGGALVAEREAIRYQVNPDGAILYKSSYRHSNI